MNRTCTAAEREIFDRRFDLYSVCANYDSKDFSTQFNTKTDVLCTCRRRRHKRDGIREMRKSSVATVGSVKILPKKNIRRVYAPDIRDTGAGSSTVFSEHKEENNESRYFENKTSSKCVGGVWEPIKIPTVSKKLSPIIQTKSNTTSPIDIQSDIKKEATEQIHIDKYSSDSLVQHIHNLEDPNKSKLSVDVMENKLEREYRKMFVTKNDDLKRPSVLRRRFDSLRKGLSKESKERTSKSLMHKDVSIASDPPSLEAKSYSNTNIFSPYTSYIQPAKKAPDAANADSDCQSVRGMFKLWGKKFNLEDEKGGKRIDVIPDKVGDKIDVTKGRSKLKKFFFNKRGEKIQKSKITTNRCEVDGLTLRIESKYNLDEDIMRKSWLKRFLTTKVDSRRSVKIRWNNRLYTSSSTVFQLIDCVYNGIAVGSQNEVIEPNYFMPQTIEAWMVPEIIPQAKIKPRKNIEVTYLDRKWYIDKSHRGNKIELVLQSNLIKRGDQSSDYILIDIPKGYFTDSMESNQSDEQVFRITDYESPNSIVSVCKRNLDTGDHVSLKCIDENGNVALGGDERVKNDVGDKNDEGMQGEFVNNEKKCDDNKETIVVTGENHDGSDAKYVKNKVKENKYDNNKEIVDATGENHEENDGKYVKNKGKDEEMQESEFPPKYCDVIGVGIITQRDIRDIKKPTLKIQDSASESGQTLAPRKKCEFAESYLQDYCRNWIPLGIDFFSWCISDTQLRSESNSSLNQGDGSKSCPNMFEEPVISSYNSSCSHCVALDLEGKEKKKAGFLTKFFGKCDISSTEAQSNSELKRFIAKDSIEVVKRRRIYSESGYNELWNGMCMKSCPIDDIPEEDPRAKKHVLIPDCQPREVVDQPCRKCFPGILNLAGTKPCKKKQKHTCVIPDPVCAIPPKPVCSNICSKEYCPLCTKEKGRRDNPCAGKSPPLCANCPPLTPSEIAELKKKFPECPSLPQKCTKCKTPILPQKCTKCCTAVLPNKCPKCSTPVVPMKCAKCSRVLIPLKCPTCPPLPTPIECPSCGMDMMPQKCPKCGALLVPQNCPRCGSQIMPTCCPKCFSTVKAPKCPQCSDTLPQKCPTCVPPTDPKCPSCNTPSPPPKCPECRIDISPKKCTGCATPLLPQSCPQCTSEIRPQLCSKCLTELMPQECPNCFPNSPKNKTSNCPICTSQAATPKCPGCAAPDVTQKCSKCSLTPSQLKCSNCNTRESKPNPIQIKPFENCSPSSPPKRSMAPQKCPHCNSLMVARSVSQTSIQSDPKPYVSNRASTQSIPNYCTACRTINSKPIPKPYPQLQPTNCPHINTSKQSVQCSKDCPHRNLSNGSSLDYRKLTPSNADNRDGYNIKVQDEDGQTLYERIDYRKCDKESQQLQNKICGDSYIHRLSTPSIVLNKVALNDGADGQKNSPSFENLIEINLTLKFKQGEKTEVNVSNLADTQKDEREVAKPKEIFHMHDQVRESADNMDKNEVNIKIMIKNFANEEKPKYIENTTHNEFSNNISSKFQTVSTGYSQFVIDPTDKPEDAANAHPDDKSGLSFNSAVMKEPTDPRTEVNERNDEDKSETDEENIENYLTETIRKLRSRREKKDMLKRLFEQTPFEMKTRETVKGVRHMLQAILTSDSDSSDVKDMRARFRRSDSLTNLYDFESIVEEKRETLYPSVENSDSDAPMPCMCSTLGAKLNMHRNPCCCNEGAIELRTVDVETQHSCQMAVSECAAIRREQVDSDRRGDSYVDILQTEELKKAVLEIYTEKTVTNDGTKFVARLPKFVFSND